MKFNNLTNKILFAIDFVTIVFCIHVFVLDRFYNSIVTSNQIIKIRDYEHLNGKLKSLDIDFFDPEICGYISIVNIVLINDSTIVTYRNEEFLDDFLPYRYLINYVPYKMSIDTFSLENNIAVLITEDSTKLFKTIIFTIDDSLEINFK